MSSQNQDKSLNFTGVNIFQSRLKTSVNLNKVEILTLNFEIRTWIAIRIIPHHSWFHEWLCCPGRLGNDRQSLDLSIFVLQPHRLRAIVGLIVIKQGLSRLDVLHPRTRLNQTDILPISLYHNTTIKP